MNDLEFVLASTTVFYILGANLRHYAMAKKWCKSHSRCDTELFEEKMAKEEHANVLSYVNSRVGLIGRKLAYKLYHKED